LSLPDRDKNKPGSLPDLTNFHVNPSAGGVGLGSSPLQQAQQQLQQHMMESEEMGSPYSSVS
jgi:hypothetical protein